MEPAGTPFDDSESVPDDVLDAAKAAYSRRSTGVVAALVYDSLVDDQEPPDDHILRFESDRVRFDVNVSVRPGQVKLVGVVSPTAEGRFELVREQEDVSFVCDTSDGSFEFGSIGHGLVRLSFAPADGPVIRTDWFQI